eukprot:scaffold58654_cov66-Phaeocystis_antarctica.AAC.1
MDEIWLTRPSERDKAAASTAFAARLRASGVRPRSCSVCSSSRPPGEMPHLRKSLYTWLTCAH